MSNDHFPYFSVNPASTGKVTPVTYLASSEARNSTALEMSRDSTHGKSWDDATLADPVAAARARRRRARARIPARCGNDPGVYIVCLSSSTSSAAGALPTAPISPIAVDGLLERRPELTIDGRRPSVD
jgi:hypothetical protein